MNVIRVPCLNCLDRQLNCHSKCAKYIEFKKQNKALKEKINKNKQLEIEWYNFNQNKFKRINKGR